MTDWFSRTMAGWAINIAIAWVALRTNLMRSILTTLGVMIGVLSVILAVAIGNGAKQSVETSISSLGSNMALVFPVPDREGPRSAADVGKLTMRDADALERSVEGVSGIAPQISSSIQVSVPGKRATTTGTGVTTGYAQVSNVDVETGRFITQADVQSAARVVVLGTTVATKLFGDGDAVGQVVRINKVPFDVVGLLQPKGSSFGRDNDDLALVPISTARQRFTSARQKGPDDIDVLFVGFDDTIELPDAKRQIVRILRARNNVGTGEISPFTVRTTEEFQRQSGIVTSVFQGVLVAIASISLLVGGIGIMNIMLVSVTERTREIGLRMALGAKRRDIRNQFLVEAAVLCTIGGTIGLILAYIAAAVFVRVADFPAPIGLGTSIGAILFSAFIGLAFGSYPAMRASRLSPIEALRSE